VRGDGGESDERDDHCRAGYVVRGRVQGVGFRWWTRREAQRIGVAGTVRNLLDGGVEVMVVGRCDAVARFKEAIGSGPRVARVDSLESVPFRGAPGATDFAITS